MSTPDGKTYRPWEPQRYQHEAHSPAAKLPEGDLVFFLLDTVPRLDLGRFYARALVQCDGNVLAFGNNHLCHLNLENFLHRQTPLEETQSDSRNFSGGKMDTKEIVHHPVNT